MKNLFSRNFHLLPSTRCWKERKLYVVTGEAENTEEEEVDPKVFSAAEKTELARRDPIDMERSKHEEGIEYRNGVMLFREPEFLPSLEGAKFDFSQTRKHLHNPHGGESVFLSSFIGTKMLHVEPGMNCYPNINRWKVNYLLARREPAGVDGYWSAPSSNFVALETILDVTDSGMFVCEAEIQGGLVGPYTREPREVFAAAKIDGLDRGRVINITLANKIDFPEEAQHENPNSFIGTQIHFNEGIETVVSVSNSSIVTEIEYQGRKSIQIRKLSELINYFILAERKQFMRIPLEDGKVDFIEIATTNDPFSFIGSKTTFPHLGLTEMVIGKYKSEYLTQLKTSGGVTITGWRPTKDYRRALKKKNAELQETPRRKAA